MTRSAGPALRDLYDRFGDVVGFVSLYVPEAHPGDRYPQPDTLDRKRHHARDYAERDGVRWTVMIDEINGELHQQLDPKPHAAYLVGTDGTVLWRTLWANDDRVMTAALEAVADGHVPEDREVTPLLVPMLAGTGSMWETWQNAGGHAKSDVLRQVPPVYVSGRLAGLFTTLPPLSRGVAGMTLMMAPALLGIAAARAALRGAGRDRRRRSRSRSRIARR